MPHAQILIVADDLTGASDAGVHLSQHGHPTTVLFKDAPLPDGELDGLVLDLDSRAVSGPEAAARMTHALQSVTADLMLIKIDSTLRGPLAEYLGSALAVSGRQCAIVAPALPGNGRTTVGGVQLVNGVPVHLSAAGRDPRTPVTESHLPALLLAAHAGDMKVINRTEVGTGTIVQHALQTSSWLIVDAETQDDLDHLVGQVGNPQEVLWVGTAGLAQALGRAYPGTGPATRIPIPQVSAGVLTVLGSLNDIARAQLDMLQSAGVPCVLLDFSDLQNTMTALHAALSSTGQAVLYSGPQDGAHTPEAVAQTLANTVVSAAEQGLVEALVLTGGDTAVGVSRALGASGIDVFGELEAGVPYGRLVGPLPLPVVTKAGGFGNDTTLLRAHRALCSPQFHPSRRAPDV